MPKTDDNTKLNFKYQTICVTMFYVIEYSHLDS